MSSNQVVVDVPDVFEPLLEPNRYKAAYGGRGGAKSHFFAGQLVLRCYAKKTRAVCIREVQNTIRDSVRQLLVDKIVALGLEDRFEILESEIRGANGSLIVFRGMQAYNAANIKSLEDFDIAWVEEAQTLSQHSLDLLRPTIRKNGSELWFGWNPRHDTDPVDVFFRGGHKRDNAACIKVGWQDNPWFPDVLRQEMLDDYAADPHKAEHVWGGGYELITEGSYYAKQIAAAEEQGRIGNFPYDPLLPVYTSWDIGVDDYTSVWFLQENGHEVYAIDFFECQNAGPEEIRDIAFPELIDDELKRQSVETELGRKSFKKFAMHFFPHDIKVREWGAGAKQRSLTALELGFRPIHAGVATDPADRINAVRRILPVTYFNDTPRVRLGISHLRRYTRKKNEMTGQWMGPHKDGNDHAADSFGEFAINCQIKPRPAIAAPKPKALPGQVYLPGAPEPTQSSRIRL